MLKNYTSSVPVAVTVARIETILSKSGITGIQKTYREGQLIALHFRGVLPNSKPVNIRLPANSKPIYDYLMKQIRKPLASTPKRVAEQAERTAWKLMQDWVEIQISLIEMQQAEFIEVFLPYVWDGEQTVYARIKASHFKMLPGIET